MALMADGAYTRCQLDVTNSGPGLFGTAPNAEWLFSRFFHEETFIFVASRFMTTAQSFHFHFRIRSASELVDSK